MENMANYEGKTVSFKALYPASSKPMPDGIFVAGRMLMNCCAADTQFAGMACYRNKAERHIRGGLATRRKYKGTA